MSDENTNSESLLIPVKLHIGSRKHYHVYLSLQSGISSSVSYINKKKYRNCSMYIRIKFYIMVGA